MTIHKNIVIAVVVVFVLSLVGNAYLGNKVRVLSQNPAELNAQEVKDVAARISKLMVLPSDELPTLATVSDPEKLKDQPFFANAKAGFKVLVYTKAQKAVLYDPTANKIVEVAPINSNVGATSTPAVK
ncbi:MAG: hypothetical protein RLZZ67_574 [Candidatus Parcubacteria bacterium]|jgi:hypothetical protein